MKRRLVVVTILVLLITAGSTANTFASSYREKVLGDTTKPITMSPTVEGPGLILADSPLYFLDQLKQSLRLTFAFTPEAKAKVHANIAGERFAELRFALQKNDKKASDIALQGLRESTRNAAHELSNAQFAGKDVDDLARDINQSIKEHQVALDIVEAQANGEIKAAVVWANESLTEAKTTVENALPPAELENEIRDNIIRDATKYAAETVNSAEDLKIVLDVLHEQADDAAKKNLQNRQTALEKTIEKKNIQLERIEAIKLAEEKKQDDLALSMNADAVRQAQEIVQKAQEVAKKIQVTTNTVLGATSARK